MLINEPFSLLFDHRILLGRQKSEVVENMSLDQGEVLALSVLVI